MCALHPSADLTPLGDGADIAIESTTAVSGQAGGRGRLVVALLGTCGLVASLVQTLVVPLLPELPRMVDVSPTATPWLVTVTRLSGAIATPLLARLGDSYGRRRLLLLTLSLLATGSVVCGLPFGFIGLLVGRALQGVALAPIPLSISIANALTDDASTQRGDRFRSAP
jgi:predicted MFS family arabinose efflux permease